MAKKKPKTRRGTKMKTVTGRIFEKFVNELENEKELRTIAPRLKEILNNPDAVNEDAVRTALFPGEEDDKD